MDLSFFFAFVSSFYSLKCKPALGLFGLKVTPCRGSEKTGLRPHIFGRVKNPRSSKNPPQNPRAMSRLRALFKKVSYTQETRHSKGFFGICAYAHNCTRVSQKPQPKLAFRPVWVDWVFSISRRRQACLRLGLPCDLWFRHGYAVHVRVSRFSALSRKSPRAVTRSYGPGKHSPVTSDTASLCLTQALRLYFDTAFQAFQAVYDTASGGGVCFQTLFSFSDTVSGCSGCVDTSCRHKHWGCVCFFSVCFFFFFFFALKCAAHILTRLSPIGNVEYILFCIYYFNYFI